MIGQVVNVCRTSIARDAWHRIQPLTVHGWVYSFCNGLLHDLGIDVHCFDMLQSCYGDALARIQIDKGMR